MMHIPVMSKRKIGTAVAAVLLVSGFVYLWTYRDAPPANQCESDCMNDSGGKAWCADYCKNAGAYGPAKTK
jgi:hypothetical protein